MSGTFPPAHDPIEGLLSWLNEARVAGEPMPEAMTLSTVGSGGMPNARMVLFKGWDAAGDRLTFYTNYRSTKSKELLARPKAALVFHWPRLERQIRVQGEVRKLTRHASEAYFATRARESQIGAWASPQSQKIKNRADLEALALVVEKKFSGRPVPCPPHWGGFGLRARVIEFWHGEPGRLHDRVRFTRGVGKKATWKQEWLGP